MRFEEFWAAARPVKDALLSRIAEELDCRLEMLCKIAPTQPLSESDSSILGTASNICGEA